MTAMTSPVACSRPARIAANAPKLRDSAISVESKPAVGRRSWSRAKLRSGLPSTTSTASNDPSMEVPMPRNAASRSSMESSFP